MKRSKWKGPFVQKINLLNKKVLKLPRYLEITLNMVGKTCSVYSGKEWLQLLIVEEMVSHKLGEFVFTRGNFVFKKKKK
jgi:small subunit ribosomal protein S19